MTHRALAFALAFAFSSALASPGQTGADTRRLEQIASDAFANGFYSDALAAWREAYGRTRVPTLLLYMASCQEQLLDRKGAAETLRQYLAVYADAPERTEIAARIAALDPPPAPAAAPAPPPPRCSTLDRAALGTAIAASAVVIIAGALTIAAAASYADLSHRCPSTGCTPDDRSHQLALDGSADAFWAIGAAAAVTSLTLHLISRRVHRRVSASAGAFALSF